MDVVGVSLGTGWQVPSFLRALWRSQPGHLSRVGGQPTVTIRPQGY